jgi:hypothetical protein
MLFLGLALRQTQGEEYIIPHAEPVEAFCINALYKCFVKVIDIKDFFQKSFFGKLSPAFRFAPSTLSYWKGCHRYDGG